MKDERLEQFKNDYYEYRKKKYKEHVLRTLFFEVTLRCNARCEHCGSSCGDVIQKDEITKDEIYKVLEDIKNAGIYNPRNVMLAITGGEPLVRKDLFEIMGYAHNLGYPWGMTTNGILIDEEVVKKMAETHMYSVSVSLDGLKETHEKFRKVPGSYEKILKGLELMLKEPAIKVVQVTTCVNKKNIDELEEMYQMLLKMGIKNWRVIEVDPIGRAKDNDDILLDGEGFKRMIRFIREKQVENKIEMTYGCGHFLGNGIDYELRKTPFFCYTGVNIGGILSNGDIFVCPDVKRRPELIQGNIRKDNFMEVWEKKYEPYRKMTRTCNSFCKRCEDWKICGGDAFHTWDFDENKPLVCPRELFKEDYEIQKELQKLRAKNTKTEKTTKKAKKTTKKVTKKTTKKKELNTNLY